MLRIEITKEKVYIDIPENFILPATMDWVDGIVEKAKSILTDNPQTTSDELLSLLEDDLNEVKHNPALGEDIKPTHRFIDGPINDDTDWFKDQKGKEVCITQEHESVYYIYADGVIIEDGNPFRDIKAERFEKL